MNIAILIPALGGGGAERVASLIGNYYVDKGHSVYYFIGNNAKKCVYKTKGKIIRTEIAANQKSMIALLNAASIMRKYKKKYHIDVSVSFMEEFNYINVLSKGRDIVITRICTILSQRNELRGQCFYYDHWAIHFFYNLADKVVVMTDYAQNEMICNYKIRKKNIIKIPNPILPLEPAENNDAWEYGSHAVLCIGRLENVKQHNVAIRAFSTILDEVPDAKMIILGTGPNEGRLKSLIRDLRLENHIFLLGFQNDISRYIQKAQVFLMTSYTEGFPNSMVEAMSMGLPAISIDCPGAPREILKVTEKYDKHIQYGKYGVVTPYEKNNFMAKEAITDGEKMIGNAIKEMLMNDELRSLYKKASLRRARMYNTEKIMSIWNKIMNIK